MGWHRSCHAHPEKLRTKRNPDTSIRVNAGRYCWEVLVCIGRCRDSCEGTTRSISVHAMEVALVPTLGRVLAVAFCLLLSVLTVPALRRHSWRLRSEREPDRASPGISVEFFLGVCEYLSAGRPLGIQLDRDGGLPFQKLDRDVVQISCSQASDSLLPEPESAEMAAQAVNS